MLTHLRGERLTRTVGGFRKRLWLIVLPIAIALGSLLVTVPAEASTYQYSANNLECPGGAYLWPAERASLHFQCDGNLVIYCNNGHAVWSSETDGSYGYYAFQSDGNMVIYGEANRQDPIWSTGTAHHSGDYAVMQDDSNFVIYASPGKPLWASGTSGKC